MNQRIRFGLILALILAVLLNGCSAKRNCPVTEPVWVKPPEDAAVLNTPEFEYYFVNEDSSIMASAWWAGSQKDFPLVLEEGIKVGWFRPEGAELIITGRRLDGDAPALESHVPCCYPTRFQATGLYFPSEGCWEVNAKAADKEINFIVWVEP
ncbi:hypothetical protein FBQ99_08125 [Chloroflexi bacterium CFX2]|nr:hypothetical protein [Chloroflexi bacterium CFX2]